MVSNKAKWFIASRATCACAAPFDTARLPLLALLGVLSVMVSPSANAMESPVVQGLTRRVELEGPGDAGGMPCDVVQMLDANGDPVEYFMDVGSVVCADAECEIVTVRIHFDPLGNYQRYELPKGGNLTKLGHKPFSAADRRKLHEILSNPYSQLKSIEWSQITVPTGTTEPGKDVDAITGATPLSRRNMVVVGAAYTCCTLWHWSHGAVTDVIRDMTVRASDKQDLLRYLQSEEDKYVLFAADQLRMQNRFDAETIAAVVQVARYDSDALMDAALRYLEEASNETGIDCFFRCRDDEDLVANPVKRVRFLEALKNTTLAAPSGYFHRLVDWLPRADSYYEAHLLLSLLEREKVASEQAINGAFSLLENENPVVVRRSYRYLKALKLNDVQQTRLRAFEKMHPDP